MPEIIRTLINDAVTMNFFLLSSKAVKGLSQRAADFGTDFERAFRVLYTIFRIIEDGI